MIKRYLPGTYFFKHQNYDYEHFLLELEEMFESIFVPMRKIFKAEFDKVFPNARCLVKVYNFPIYVIHYL